MVLYPHPTYCARFSGVRVGVGGGGNECPRPLHWAQQLGDWPRHYDEISWFEDKWREIGVSLLQY